MDREIINKVATLDIQLRKMSKAVKTIREWQRANDSQQELEILLTGLNYRTVKTLEMVLRNEMEAIEIQLEEL